MVSRSWHRYSHEVRRLLCLTLSLSSCGGGGGEPTNDAQDPDATAPGCDLNAPFGAPVPLDELNSSASETGGALTADQLSIYFATERPGEGTVGATDIWVATRSSISDSFGTPSVVAGVNTTISELWPTPTGDGTALYINRDTVTTGWDIMVATRATATSEFGAPMQIPSLTNQSGSSDDDNQFVVPNHRAIYFRTYRFSNNDIYRAARNDDGTFGFMQPVVMSTNLEGSAVVTADELTLYYTTNEPSAGMGLDVFVATRATTADQWGAPQRVDVLNTNGSDHVTWLSPDGCNIYLNRFVDGRGFEIFKAAKPL